MGDGRSGAARRQAPSYRLKFQFPFWLTSLLAALDTFSELGFVLEEEGIGRGLAWFQSNQFADGLCETGHGSGKGAVANRRWIRLVACHC